MRRISVLSAAIAALAVLMLLGAADGALADGLQFTAPTMLPHGDPNGSPFYGGGEPSLAFDPNGDGHTYVTAPQGIPSAAGGALGGSSTGVAYWASDDHGVTFPRSGLTGTGTGGGDSDVAVLSDHTVLVADLEATATAICISHDFATTFPNCSNGVTPNQQGPENDREWLTPGTKPGEVYLTYHDFTAGFPIIERSTDGGQTFVPCGTIIDPSGPAAQTYTPQGGTLVSKPVIGKDGTVYVEFTTPDQAAPPVGATLNHLYMAVAKGGCTGQTVFENHVIYQNPGADLAKIFQASAIDGGGQLYVLAGGKTKAGESDTGLWLFTSIDGGANWTKTQVNPPDLHANVFPTIAGGAARGQAVFGWFGTATSNDPNTQNNQWRFYAGETLDGGKTFATSQVSPTPLHYGDICTQGIFCGLVPGQPGNRNLADFASVAVDPSTGCAALAIPGDPYNRPDLPNGDNTFGSSAFFSRQVGPTGCLNATNAGLSAGQLGGSSSGGGGTLGATCLDRIAPVSTPTKLRRRGHRILISGTASDRGCGAKGRGKVHKMRVAIGRRYAGQKCRYLQSRNGRFGPKVSCLRTKYLTAKGRTKWRISLRSLPRGRYVVWSRGVDAAGNIERKARTRNLARFRVR